MTIWMNLAAMLLLILVAAEVFTNAVEHLGERLGISEGMTGSVFAAIGTAMPESIIPLVAILAGTEDARVNAEIGVGAILGAPLMLSTVALCLMALSVFGHRGLNGPLRPERNGLRRDLHFFLAAFGISIAALAVPPGSSAVRVALAVGLVLIYFLYVLLTLRVSAKLVADGHGTHAHKEMLLCRLGLPDSALVLAVQLLAGLALLVAAAKGMVQGVSSVSAQFGFSPLLFSMLVIPIATELPESVNSVLWIRRGKDTLAFGNITGAMVLQGSLLPAVGISLTPWQPSVAVLSGAALTYLAALWMAFLAHHGRLSVWHLLVNGGLYAGYLLLILVL